MLTRLKVIGFKSLKDIDISFGPFTCIAGVNGVGKSNIFDAIVFLRDLTEFSIVEAASRVRDPSAKTGDIQAIFSRTPSGYSDSLQFEADFIAPKEVVDDFGRPAKTTSTFLRYTLKLKYVGASKSSGEKIEIVEEDLTYLQMSQARRLLGFNHSKQFRESIIDGRRTTKFISTETIDGKSTINLHQDGSSGRPFKVPAASSPKTILGGINADSHPTVLAAKREMQSWTLLQLEPTALRQPDNFSADPHVSANGAHMPATLLRLNTNMSIANKLSGLIPDIKDVKVDQDDGRRLNTLTVKTHENISYPARSLSDGTLRFLALSILSADNESGRLICLEEPENGIHPSRIPVMLNLLESMTVDPTEFVDEDNPLRQVIVNTHSPAVVSRLSADDLIVTKLSRSEGLVYTELRCIEGTWREKREILKPMQSLSKGDLIDYLTLGPLSLLRAPSNSRTTRVTVHEYAKTQGVFDFMKTEE